MNMYSYTVGSLTSLSNDVKDALLKSLEREGLLKGEDSDLGGKYIVVVHEPGFFGRLYAKLAGEKKDGGLIITVSKVV